MKHARHGMACAMTAALIAAGALGCGGGRTGGQATFESEGVAVTLTLPAGWQRGEPRASGGWRPSAEADFFYADAGADDPSGDVMVFPLEGESLEAHVEAVIEQQEGMNRMGIALAGKLDEMTGGAASAETAEAKAEMEAYKTETRAYKIGDLDAAEVITNTPRATLTVFVRKGDKVAVVTLGAPKEEFAGVEKVFRDIAATIDVK